MAAPTATVHASAVLAGPRAALIRGPAGSGKSRLALGLIQAAQCGLIPFARLVGDDRIELAVAHGRLLARPSPALAGLIEVRGLGIRRLAHEPVAVVGLVVDLAIPQAERLPEIAERQVAVDGIILPRLAVGRGCDPIAAVLASLLTLSAEV
ncbi:MAG TPA: HPr kinase/phosphatase C-terminal domain-containing protein [Xanthobacteraceae bacterium]|jgi:serine kinase of HPr protein (carbohydrate metabolism regulator)